MAELVRILYPEGDTRQEQLQHFAHVCQSSPTYQGVELFKNIADRYGYTRILLEAFSWLMSIYPGYLIYRRIRDCMIKPFMMNRLARQFGYDQLHVGNPNPELKFDRSLL